MKSLIISAAIAYLLGSIPFGYVLVRVFRGQDVRETGSGNIGATNVSRMSPGLGVATLLLDALKGLAAVAVAERMFPGDATAAGAAAVFAVVGHMFPLWLKFRGGKGVATGLGGFVLLVPKAILLVIAVFVGVFLLFRFVSLASILAVACFPLLVWLCEPVKRMPIAAFAAIASLLIIAKHHANIERLLTRTEPRFEWSRR